MHLGYGRHHWPSFHPRPTCTRQAKRSTPGVNISALRLSEKCLRSGEEVGQFGAGVAMTFRRGVKLLCVRIF